MQKATIHLAFENWLYSEGWIKEQKSPEFYYRGNETILLDVLKERFISELENKLQDYA